uniref:Uncharacterized protein n=1 Tax=Sus scrofa TaxID=9823 RepID=A0A4X1SDE3_PIG
MTDELELEKLKLAELQRKHRDPGDAAKEEAKHRGAEMRNSISAQVLDQSAWWDGIRTRFNRNPQKCKPKTRKQLPFNRSNQHS